MKRLLRYGFVDSASSFIGPQLMFESHSYDTHGRYHLTLTVKELLDAGYARGLTRIPEG